MTEKIKIWLYIDKVYNLETNKRGFAVILHYVESGESFQITNQFDSLDEAKKALENSAYIRRKMGKYDVEIITKKIV